MVSIWYGHEVKDYTLQQHHEILLDL